MHQPSHNLKLHIVETDGVIKHVTDHRNKPGIRKQIKIKEKRDGENERRRERDMQII
jgi:hypothetical protein